MVNGNRISRDSSIIDFISSVESGTPSGDLAGLRRRAVPPGRCRKAIVRYLPQWSKCAAFSEGFASGAVMAGSDVTDPSLPKMLDCVVSVVRRISPQAMRNLGGKIVNRRFHFPAHFHLQERSRM